LPSASTPKGYHIHATDLGAGFTAYVGNDASLFELNATNVDPWTRVDKTRLVGGAYSPPPFGPGGTFSGWQGASFGDAVIMTNFSDDPQLLTSPAAANFVKLAQSAGGVAGTGMDPRARFVFPVQGNLFLAYLLLPTALLRQDGSTELAAGTYPFHVCWSATDNVRQYGSYSATPNLVGCGLQPLNFDLGYITGGIGGEYALIAMQRGWVRVDGPPYTFRPVSQGDGCIHPNSIVRLNDDVYFWGPVGPMVFRAGDSHAVSLGANRLVRTIIDRILAPTVASKLDANPVRISAAADHINNLVFFSYVPADSSTSRRSITLVYDTNNDRFALGGDTLFASVTGGNGVHFLRSRPVPASTDVLFCPGRDLTGIGFVDTPSTDTYPAVPSQALQLRTVTMTTSFRRLHDTLTTRIRRVRIIYSISTDSGNPGDSSTITVYSKNKPYAPADTLTVYGPYTALDTHGAVPTPTTVFADFHKVKASFEPVTLLVKEISGIEVEYETGPPYSA
jgi:hypothetical protein